MRDDVFRRRGQRVRREHHSFFEIRVVLFVDALGDVTSSRHDGSKDVARGTSEILARLRDGSNETRRLVSRRSSLRAVEKKQESLRSAAASRTVLANVPQRDVRMVDPCWIIIIDVDSDRRVIP